MKCARPGTRIASMKYGRRSQLAPSECSSGLKRFARCDACTRGSTLSPI
ncbi:hypothetical protein DM77_3693 [Burkholderia mallei]|nr:hypothetical protein DM77_3693 [Burkholderia mallei]